MMETWKNIKGYESLYEVSNLGRVRTIKSGRIKRQPIHWKGYPMITLRRPVQICKSYRTHRLVAEAFIENPNNYPQVNHINGIKTDNRAENLEWCNNSMNQQHSIKNGLRVMPKSLESVRSRILLHLEMGIYCNGMEAAAMLGVHHSWVHRRIRMNKSIPNFSLV